MSVQAQRDERTYSLLLNSRELLVFAALLAVKFGALRLIFGAL